MNSLKTYMAWLVAGLAAAAGLSACQNDFDALEMTAPVASNTPNTTILELKQKYWDDATNYIDTIGVRDDGSHYIIHGTVVSSDEASNVFKSLVIQDGTAAMAISVNSYNLYLKYRQGQEIVIDATGMYIGKYNGLQQLGYPEWYENGNAWEASFMSPEFFAQHVELNGLPNVAAIDTLEINSFSELPATTDGLMQYQSRLVRFNNVAFTNGGKEQFSTYHSSGVNQTISDIDGTTLPVRTSGYSNFWNNTLPEGRGDVVCILSYYGSTGWQLILNDYDGCMNFGNPTIASGSESNPWTVEQAVALEQAGSVKSGWITGYIVGAVGPEVTTVSSNSDIEWTSTPILDNTLVIGATPDTKDLSEALVIELTSGSTLQTYGNLVNNPGVYGKQIWIQGTLDKAMGTYGITGNTGANGTWKIDGVDTSAVTSINQNFDAATSLPDGWTQKQVAGTKTWYVPTYDNNNYASMTGYKGTAPFDSWLFTPAVNISMVSNKVLSFDTQVAGYGSTTTVFEVYVLNSTDPETATLKDKLTVTLPTATASGYSSWVNSGAIDLSKYTGTVYIGWRYYATADSNYATWCLDNVILGEGAGSGSGSGSTDPETPTTPTSGYLGDFNSFNDSTAKSSYGTYTNATGWTATNCAILGGLDSGTDSNPYFTFIGSGTTLAPTMNGKTTALGTIVSPTLTGGIKTLTFNYGFAFSDTKCQFTVTVKDTSGNVVKEDTVTLDSITKLSAYEYSLDVNYTGDFTIELANQGYSNSTSNKDRVSIWNLTWTK
jgi:hypothetical protein